jgi:MHS family proline/betaine transporter-like MFS transporter
LLGSLSIGYRIGATNIGSFVSTLVETVIHVTGDKLTPRHDVLTAAVLSDDVGRDRRMADAACPAH